MKFGVFDHMDEGGVSLEQQFEERLKLIEAYDRFNFYAYHLAEHHGTPLGLAPSPGIFMAAVAQRTEAATIWAARVSVAFVSPDPLDRRDLHA